jgi:hypothetical protein
MNLILNDDMRIAYVLDFDETEWNTEKSKIPWNYIIEFQPNIDDTQKLNTGRELKYDIRSTYVSYRQDSAFICYPVTSYVQQLLALPSDPNVPTEGGTIS